MAQSLVVNLEDVKSFDPVPDGRYTLKVSEASVAASKGPKTSGIPLLKLTLQVADGEYKDRRIWDQLLTAGEYAWKMQQFLEAAIGPVADKRMTLDLDSVIGVILEADVVVDPNTVEAGGNGQPRNQVKRYLPIGGGSNDEAAGDLDALFK